jgi:hypothetical protein
MPIEPLKIEVWVAGVEVEDEQVAAVAQGSSAVDKCPVR